MTKSSSQNQFVPQHIPALLKLVFSKKQQEVISYDNINSIALVKLGAVGDVIMTTSLVDQLRKLFPNARIDYHVGKSSSAALHKNSSLTSVITFDDSMMYKKKVFKLLNFSRKLRKEKYDVAIMLDKSYLSGIFLRLCGAKHTIGFDRFGEGFMYDAAVSYNNTDHEITQYLRLITLLNKESPQYLPPKCTSVAVSSALPKKSVVFFPGGASNPGVALDKSRRLPEETLRKITEELSKKYNVVLHGGPTDVVLNKKIAKGLSVTNITGSSKIPETISTLKDADVIICHDSGPMHMGAVFGKRMVCMFGSTNPLRKAPRHMKCITLWHDKKRYLDEYDLRKTPADEQFMQTITSDDVLQAVEDVLSDTSKQNYIEIREKDNVVEKVMYDN